MKLRFVVLRTTSNEQYKHENTLKIGSTYILPLPIGKKAKLDPTEMRLRHD